MNRSSIHPLPVFFDRYINLVEDVPIVAALESRPTVFNETDLEKIRALGDRIYAPGQWTIRDIVQHINDNERIQAYRALRIARNDQTPLPGYEENDYANAALAARRSLDDLLEEFILLRKSSIVLFKSLQPDMLSRKGFCSGKEMSVLALGFVLAGHQEHHVRIVRERYFPLLQ